MIWLPNLLNLESLQCWIPAFGGSTSSNIKQHRLIFVLLTFVIALQWRLCHLSTLSMQCESNRFPLLGIFHNSMGTRSVSYICSYFKTIIEVFERFLRNIHESIILVPISFIVYVPPWSEPAIFSPWKIHMKRGVPVSSDPVTILIHISCRWPIKQWSRT